MSAERYEISECELDVLAITGPEGTYYIDGENIEARAIRQQSADIAELRAELAAAVAERDGLGDYRSEFEPIWDGLQDALEGERHIDSYGLGESEVECVRRVLRERDILRARLAAIDGAPTVAYRWELIGNVHTCFPLIDRPIGTELIARPAKDSPGTFEETARSAGIRFDDIENHENKT